jgi:DNA-binding XRE family transcriptional regulator
MGKEIKVIRPAMSAIEKIAYNESLQKLAVASMGSIKVFST